MKKYTILIISIMMASMWSCTDILNKSPLDELFPDNFYKNETEARMGLMGIYNAIVPHDNPLPFYQFEFMTDNTSGMDWTGSLEFGAWNHNSSSVTARAKWARSYQVIGRANRFIESMEPAPIDNDTKNVMIAEARFLRGMMYSELIALYGDVPLVLKTLTPDEAKVSRTPKEQVLTAIVADFDFAAQYALDVHTNDVGRATKGAALAYKARTLLYCEKWTEAAQAAKQVIDLNRYSLYSNYEAMFEEANENNVEVIFDLQYVRDLFAQPWPSSATVFSIWPCGSVTLSLVDSYYMKNGLPITDPNSGYNEQDPFTNRDPRLEASIVVPGAQWGDKKLIPATLEQVQGVTGVKTRKYADLNNPNPDNSGLNTILMRYADVLLIRAEALIESGSTDQEIYDLINQVRQRPSVMMPKVEDVEGSGLSTEELRKIVRHERRVEFFMEGTRYYDMLRWKDESYIHNSEGYDISLLSDPTDPAKWVFRRVQVDPRAFDSKKGWLWPIPQVEIQNNENLVQNTGF